MLDVGEGGRDDEVSLDPRSPSSFFLKGYLELISHNFLSDTSPISGLCVILHFPVWGGERVRETGERLTIGE